MAVNVLRVSVQYVHYQLVVLSQGAGSCIFGVLGWHGCHNGPLLLSCGHSELNDHCDTQVTPGHQRCKSQPLGSTQPTNNEQAKHTLLLKTRSRPPPSFTALTLSLVTVFKQVYSLFYIVSNLMMASQETAETCSWYAIVHANIVVFFDCYLLIIVLP